MSEDGLVLPVPEGMRICFLIVGTHGDINPFLGLAGRLENLGHRVRVATHKQHRKLVLSKGFDFFPLGGDARQLSKWMVETGGTVLGEARNIRVVPQKTAMTREITASTWPALTEPSPDDIEGTAFEADAVIANPPAFGHIHVCEALGIPLHIMFPQPWYYGTQEFPHPMIGYRYDEGKTERNFTSYALFEAVVWSSMEVYMGRWRRKVLDVPTIYFGQGVSTIIPDSNIPFSAMWSPSFVPKPSDWPDHCRVVGTFTTNKPKDPTDKSSKIDTTPFTDLVEWLDKGSKPIFVGFGSMVIEDPSQLAELIKSAAEIADCRVVVQSSWSKLDVEGTDRCHNVGPCPHDWLLPQTCAVVHHGGAGTTAAGLRHGLPTFVCPFFGDQHMWGEMVRRAKVGPAPCPVDLLTVEILAEKFVELQKPEVKTMAEQMAEEMAREDGIQGGLDHFLADLPRDNMLCDVSLLLGEARLAKYDVWGRDLGPSFGIKKLNPHNGIKVSVEVAALLKSWGYDPVYGATSMDYFKQWCRNLGSVFAINYRRHAVTKYALGRVRTPSQGMAASISGFFRHLGLAIIQICYRPDVLARRYGLVGCLLGWIVAPFFSLYEVWRAFMVLIDRFITGICNGCCNKTWLTSIDPHRMTQVREMGVIPAEVNEVAAHGIPDDREKQLYRAGEMAVMAKGIFVHANPFFPEGHWHYRVVTASRLLSTFKKSKNPIKLSDDEYDTLCNSLRERGDQSLSFSMFLLLIREAISSRPNPRALGTSRRSLIGAQLDYNELFGAIKENITDIPKAVKENIPDMPKGDQIFKKNGSN